MTNQTAAMLVIGDEILSGRTRDINANVLAVELTAKGIDLEEVRFVPDQSDRIVDALNALRRSYTHVFTSGGIGPTHDDITADCIAEAFGVGIDVRPDARAILEAYYAQKNIELNDARLRMARIPDTAHLIDNPVSKAPGFTIGNVHVMAGVPSVFKAMLDAVLAGLASGEAMKSVTLRMDRPEGEIAGPLAAFAVAHSDLSVGCYPFNENGRSGCNIVMRGTDGALLERLLPELSAALT